MRAVILATGYQQNLQPLILHKPMPMLKIADRPIIEHLIESLNRFKITEFHLILSHLPHEVENYLRDGEHWGIKIIYYLTRDPFLPFTTFVPSFQEWDEPILIGNVETLPVFDPTFMKNENKEQSSLLFYSPSKLWTGWGIFHRQNLSSLSTYTTLSEWLNPQFHTPYRIYKGHLIYSIHHFKDLQKANLHVLAHSSEELRFPATARQVGPGIWTSRSVSIHPTAQLIPPVFIGEHCQIHHHAKIGPNTIIENRCFIDNDSTVQNSLICQHSYIGQGLFIQNSIIDRNLLINLSLETHITVGEDFILGEMHPPSFQNSIFRNLGRLIAFILLLLFLPLVGIVRIFREFHKHPCVLSPALYNQDAWKTFSLLSFKKKGDPHPPGIPKGFINSLPILFNIVKGEMHFTGVQPRTIEEVKQLPKDWQHLYLSSQTGLITLASVELPDDASEEEIYTSEAYYIAHSTFFNRIKLCFRWLWKQFSRQ